MDWRLLRQGRAKRRRAPTPRCARAAARANAAAQTRPARQAPLLAAGELDELILEAGIGLEDPQTRAYIYEVRAGVIWRAATAVR